MIGQTIEYTFTVADTGNVTLTDVGVTDHPTEPADGVVPTCQSVEPERHVLRHDDDAVPGQTATFTGTQEVTQADLDHGTISDTATADGISPEGGTTAPSNPVTVDEVHVTVDKSANPPKVSWPGHRPRSSTR